jgi:ketosteroid isomerase-like protein
MSCAEIFNQFVTAINGHDTKAITALMTSDHMFVDSIGNGTCGATSMEAGWRGYFVMCPDYWIQPEHVLAENGQVLADGDAGGTIDGISRRQGCGMAGIRRQ